MTEYNQTYEAIVRKMALLRERFNAGNEADRADFTVKMAELKNQLLALTRTKYPAPNLVYEVAALPHNEAERMQTLRNMDVLDTPFEEVFNKIVELAAHLCGTPIALISLIDENRQWFKANYGLSGAIQTPREDAFCAHTILQRDVMEVIDARADPRFAQNPLVTGSPEIRFYAAAPLIVDDGIALGTLCVIDQQINLLTDHQKASLNMLAALTSECLTTRRLLNKN